MTFGQLNALYRRHVQAHEHFEILAGIMASASANFGYRAPKAWATPATFGLDPQKRRVASREVSSPESQVEQLRGWYSCWLPPKASQKEELNAE